MLPTDFRHVMGEASDGLDYVRDSLSSSNSSSVSPDEEAMWDVARQHSSTPDATQQQSPANPPHTTPSGGTQQPDSSPSPLTVRDLLKSLTSGSGTHSELSESEVFSYVRSELRRKISRGNLRGSELSSVAGVKSLETGTTDPTPLLQEFQRASGNNTSPAPQIPPSSPSHTIRITPPILASTPPNEPGNAITTPFAFPNPLLDEDCYSEQSSPADSAGHVTRGATPLTHAMAHCTVLSPHLDMQPPPYRPSPQLPRSLSVDMNMQAVNSASSPSISSPGISSPSISSPWRAKRLPSTESSRKLRRMSAPTIDHASVNLSYASALDQQAASRRESLGSLSESDSNVEAQLRMPQPPAFKLPTSDSFEAVKTMDRKARNREIAKRSREKKRVHLESMEHHLSRLEISNRQTLGEVHGLARENARLRSEAHHMLKELSRVAAENEHLKEYVSTISQMEDALSIQQITSISPPSAQDPTRPLGSRFTETTRQRGLQ